MIWQPQSLLEGQGRCNPTDMRDNWDKCLSSEGIKAKVNSKWHVSFLPWTAETRSTIKVFLILHFASDPELESESEQESESIRSPESESESEQPHHDSSLVIALFTVSEPAATVVELQLEIQLLCSLLTYNNNHDWHTHCLWMWISPILSLAFRLHNKNHFGKGWKHSLEASSARGPCLAVKIVDMYLAFCQWTSFTSWGF